MDPWTIIGWVLVAVVIVVALVFCVALIAATQITIQNARDNRKLKNQSQKN